MKKHVYETKKVLHSQCSRETRYITVTSPCIVLFCNATIQKKADFTSLASQIVVVNHFVPKNTSITDDI